MSWRLFHARTVLGDIRRLISMGNEEVMAFSKEIGAPYEMLKETEDLGHCRL